MPASFLKCLSFIVLFTYPFLVHAADKVQLALYTSSACDSPLLLISAYWNTCKTVTSSKAVLVTTTADESQVVVSLYESCDAYSQGANATEVVVGHCKECVSISSYTRSDGSPIYGSVHCSSTISYYTSSSDILTQNNQIALPILGGSIGLILLGALILRKHQPERQRLLASDYKQQSHAKARATARPKNRSRVDTNQSSAADSASVHTRDHDPDDMDNMNDTQSNSVIIDHRSTNRALIPHNAQDSNDVI
eukprot:c6578_g1_i2.p1 GENE.c6578_g1_i2~~c6578_g1_i2.p1  ORF type:complete len:251 (+),score=38.07 c6578_g1_i2:104-856(+)